MTALCNFLLLPADPGLTEPPAIPLSLDGLPSAVYLEAARHYVERYPCDRKFYKYTRKTRQRYPYAADTEFKEKARAHLQACINVDRSALAPLRTFGSYDAAHEQQQFVRKVLFPRRWNLEELASEMLAFVEFVQQIRLTLSKFGRRCEHSPLPRRPRRPGTTPSQIRQVRERDVKCRLTGVGAIKPQQLSPQQLAEAQEQAHAGRVFVPNLQVVHGLPFQMGQTSFALVEALTGIACSDWLADSVENAFLAQPQVHEIFGIFLIFPEWSNGEIFIRGRTGPGNPIFYLNTFSTDRSMHPSQHRAFLDTSIRPRFDTSIPDMDSKYFILHKFIGDIVWMSGGVSPISDDDDDDEDDLAVSDSNICALLGKLRSPAMDLLPRERETMFGPRMALVHKDDVWEQ
ncbi:hypothetical protein DFH06DRAFT_1299334 [Mycena polygramma]|nr:hypothetical protein DFH06DRAFT_1299334 [Mycena polygramma]